MNYREYKPRPELNSIVACYWSLDLDTSSRTACQDIVLPDGCLELIINSAEPFSRYDTQNNDLSMVKEYAIVGQRRHAIEIRKTGAISFFAIRLKPFGLKALLDIPSSDITDQIFEVPKVKERFAHPIRGVLESNQAFPLKLKAIEDLLMFRLGNTQPTIPYIKAAVEQIIHSKGQFNVGDFCNRNNIHKSTLQKRFLSSVGLTPKEYACIIRFNQTHAMLTKNPHLTNLTQTAIDCGYYDQSHMIREFKKHSGSCPTRFLKANYELPEIAATFSLSINNYFPAEGILA